MTDHKKAKTLLDRYFSNNCTPGEQTIVEDWYDNIHLGHSQDITAWAAASRSLFLSQQEDRHCKQHFLSELKWVAAAAVLVLIASSYGYFANRLNLSNKAAVASYAAITGPLAFRQILLPDRMVVWLNANSSLRWYCDFTLHNRLLLLEGEASFDVHHNTAHSFVVHTYNADIKVLSTLFNVKTDPQNEVTPIALLQGKVAEKLNAGQSWYYNPAK